MLRIEGNHPVCVDVLSASGLCVAGSSGSVIVMGYGVGCGVTFRFQDRCIAREGKSGT